MSVWVKIRSIFAQLDGRWAAAGMVTGVLIAVYILGKQTDFVSVWARLGVEHIWPPFADMRFLTSALEAHRARVNPYVSSPFDPLLRPLNYPRAWLTLSAFGLGPRHTVAIALVLAAGFYTAMMFLVGRITVGQGLVYGVLLCSPPVMLGIERGNIDLVIFVLVTVAALTFDQKAGYYACYILVTLAAILKLYPVCGFAVGVRERRRRGFVVLALGLAVFAVYVYCIRADISFMVANTPQIKEISFGRRVLFEKLASMKLSVSVEGWSTLAVVASVVAALIISRVVKRPEFSAPASAAMTVGAGIYAGTFVAMNSFNYRLMFLLLLVPQLFAWGERRDAYRWVGKAFILIIIGAMLLASARYPQFFIPKEILNWSVFIFCVFVLICLSRDASLALFSRSKSLG
jgi:hypothetical protein